MNFQMASIFIFKTTIRPRLASIMAVIASQLPDFQAVFFNERPAFRAQNVSPGGEMSWAGRNWLWCLGRSSGVLPVGGSAHSPCGVSCPRPDHCPSRSAGNWGKCAFSSGVWGEGTGGGFEFGVSMRFPRTPENSSGDREGGWGGRGRDETMRRGRDETQKKSRRRNRMERGNRGDGDRWQESGEGGHLSGFCPRIQAGPQPAHPPV